MATGLGTTLYAPKINSAFLFAFATTFTLSFILHEIAHKITAQIYGLWAEFRLTLFGVIITLISVFSIFKIISPGAVVISGYTNRETIGKTAMSGPLTNIIIATLSIGVALTTSSPFLWIVTVLTAWINALIALLNLIPFGIIDGYKIFRWNKIVWAFLFLVSIFLALFILFHFELFLIF